MVFTGEDFYDRERLTVSRHDSCVFFLRNSEELLGVNCCYIDGFLRSGVPVFEKSVIDKLRHEFRIGSEETNAFMYLGVNIRLLDETVSLSQKDSIEKILPLEKSLLDTQFADSRSKMRSLVGKLQWVASKLVQIYLSESPV